MTAVEGWFSDKLVKGAELKRAETLSPEALEVVSQNIAINRSCTVRFKDEDVRATRSLEGRSRCSRPPSRKCVT